MPQPVEPALAAAGVLPTGDGWAFEFKWDGVRAVAEIADGTLRLWARSGSEITAAYPELRGLPTALPDVTDVVLDGEMVVLDATGRPSFTMLAERMHVRDPGRAARLAVSAPATYFVFDVLRLAGRSLLDVPYRDRRTTLESLGLAGPAWAVPPSFADGPATKAASLDLGLEGVVAKRIDSVYRPGVRDWVKVKNEVSDEFVVGGWRPGARRLGSLLIGAVTDAGLSYVGRVGGGISGATERSLLALLEPLAAGGSPFATPVPREDARGTHWVHPELVVEVTYGARTPDGRLRFPRFKQLRPDKPVSEL